MSRDFDVICLGRAAVDLYGLQRGGRLEEVQSFARYLGGSSANVAVALARLGLRVSMLTRVGAEPMGRFVREELVREGIDVDHVRADPQRLTGLVLLGIERAEHSPHIFYRENCADMGLVAEDIEPGHIAAARALAITGTHLSQPGPRAAVHRAAELAGAFGTRVVLDIDYRPVLWGLVGHAAGAERWHAAPAVTAAIQELLPRCELVVGTEEEIRIAGDATDLAAALAAIRARTEALIVVKRGAQGCTVVAGVTPLVATDVAGYPVEVQNLLGAGDAFLGGFLYGWLGDQPAAECARLGNAAGALVVSRHGCAPAMPGRTELLEFRARASVPPRPDDDPVIARWHRCVALRRHAGDLCVLAFDHRQQLEQMAREAEAEPARIGLFKDLVAQAVLATMARCGRRAAIGVIVDDRYGAAALARLGSDFPWVARPVELPASRPLEFEPRRHPGLTLQTWPQRHIIKCMVRYHPDDPWPLRLEQEARLCELDADARILERELLLEVISGTSEPGSDARTTVRTLRRFYNLGIRPAWWKLNAQPDGAWQQIAELIASEDPACHGVLLLGFDASEQQLAAELAVAARHAICRGFAVGRTIFGAVARDWLSGVIDDQLALARIAGNYHRVIELWRRLRPAPATG